MANLNDGTTFGVSITGVASGYTIDSARARRWDGSHLSIHRRDDQGVMWLFFRPEQLFLDLEEAITAAELLNRGIEFRTSSAPANPEPMTSREMICGAPCGKAVTRRFPSPHPNQTSVNSANLTRRRFRRE